MHLEMCDKSHVKIVALNESGQKLSICKIMRSKNRKLTNETETREKSEHKQRKWKCYYVEKVRFNSKLAEMVRQRQKMCSHWKRETISIRGVNASCLWSTDRHSCHTYFQWCAIWIWKKVCRERERGNKTNPMEKKKWKQIAIAHKDTTATQERQRKRVRVHESTANR